MPQSIYHEFIVKKRSKAKKGNSGKKLHRAKSRVASSKMTLKAKEMPARRKAAKRQGAAAASQTSFQKVSDEVPTLEQVTITCANCGKPFRIMKLKGLSLEGTICQRCGLGEVELPESFG